MQKCQNLEDLHKNALFFNANIRPGMEYRQLLWFARVDFLLPGSYVCNLNKQSSFDLFYNTLWLKCINKIIKHI